MSPAHDFVAPSRDNVEIGDLVLTEYDGALIAGLVSRVGAGKVQVELDHTEVPRGYKEIAVYNKRGILLIGEDVRHYLPKE